MPRNTRQRLRCICSKGTTLAFYGHDSRGNSYVHQKTYRNREMNSEIVVRGGGVVILTCPSCDHTSRIWLSKGKWSVIAGKIPTGDECLPNEADGK